MDLKMFHKLFGSSIEVYCLLLVIIKVMQTIPKTINCIIDTNDPSKNTEKL